MTSIHRFFRSDFFNFEFLRLLSTAPHSGAEIAEALTAITTIKDDDPDSWSSSFYSLAVRTESLATEAAQSGDIVTSRNACLRAANYYRASQYMLHAMPGSCDSSVLDRSQKTCTLFRQAVSMLDTMTVIELAIPYEQPGYDNEIKLPGYLYLPLERNRLVDRPKTPIVINLNGGDSIQEELFFICPSLGPQLGYAVLTFDGPGQGSVLRKQAIGMRPDWEMVIRQVVDWLSEFSDTSEGSKHHLDLDQIAIVGASMGGYFALRGARDSRVKACVSIDAPYDMWDLATAKLPKWFLHGWNSGLISNSVVDFIVALVSRVNFQLKWEVEHMKWAFGTDTASTALKRLQEYSFRLPDGSEFLEDVHCACLITGAGSSLYFDIEQSTMKIFNALKNINENMKEVWIAKHPNEGGLQAKVGAFSVSNQRTFAFLDRCFSIKRLPIEVMTDC